MVEHLAGGSHSTEGFLPPQSSYTAPTVKRAALWRKAIPKGSYSLNCFGPFAAESVLRPPEKGGQLRRLQGLEEGSQGRSGARRG